MKWYSVEVGNRLRPRRHACRDEQAVDASNDGPQTVLDCGSSSARRGKKVSGDIETLAEFNIIARRGNARGWGKVGRTLEWALQREGGIWGTGLAGKRTPLGGTGKGSRGWAAAGITVAAGVETVRRLMAGTWGTRGGEVVVDLEGRAVGGEMGAGRGEAAQWGCWVRDIDGGMRPGVRTSRGGGAAVWAGMVGFGGGRSGGSAVRGCGYIRAWVERRAVVVVVVWEERVANDGEPEDRDAEKFFYIKACHECGSPASHYGLTRDNTTVEFPPQRGIPNPVI
ncbi:hypothetical protein B0H16DRAFT_1477218 [Mycena metata]|uniref:Uncharacterized protein n=1 Tax=Mycena metata TaxID=1033252 RepID=A0AAD7H9B5_9AGAR|nr:hypothetical protein B0H16DRAFT_1477218 [Mycena metata]